MTKINNITTIDKFLPFVEALEPKLGKWGGRRFYCSKTESVSMNDVVRRLKAIYSSTPPEKKSPDKVLETLSLINRRDEIADDLNDNSPLWFRILTWIKHFFTNFNFDRESILKAINKDATQNLKNKLIKELEAQPEAPKPKMKEESDQPLKFTSEEEMSKRIKSLGLKDLFREIPSEKFMDIVDGIYKNKLYNSLLIRLGDVFCGNLADPIFRKIFIDAFTSIKNNPDKFVQFARYFTFGSPLCWLFYKNRSPFFIFNLLNDLDWPNEDLKEKTIIPLIGEKICADQNSIFEIHTSLHKETGVYTINLCVGFPFLLGPGNFVNFPFEQHQNFVKEFAEGLKRVIENNIKEAKKTYKNIKISMRLGQFAECRFPASLLSPLLPYLAEIEELQSLDMNDLDKGFGDADYDNLSSLCMLPHLETLSVDISAMSQANQLKFNLNKVKTRIA